MRKALPPIGEVADLGVMPLAVYALLIHQENVHQEWADTHGIEMKGTVLKVSHIARKIGIAQPTASKAVRKLRDGGYIDVDGELQGRGSHVKLYRIVRTTKHVLTV